MAEYHGPEFGRLDLHRQTDKRGAMGLLHDIQSSLVEEKSDLGPVLLKLRLLAARLGSQNLAEWVKHESEGYPRGSELPDYRTIPVSYSGTFNGPYGSGIQNAPIPPHLIGTFAGEHWVRHEVRESMAAIDDLLASAAKGGSLGIDAANLVLLLQGKVYPGYACNSVNGVISRSSLAAIRHSVRSRVLELTIELERSVPDAAEIEMGPSKEPRATQAAAVTQIAQQVIYGNFTSVAATGDGAHVSIGISSRDTSGLQQFLTEAGLADVDAKELAELAASEEPESKAEPMGPKVRGWIVQNISKAASGTWKIGLSVATDVIKNALLKYYGLV